MNWKALWGKANIDASLSKTEIANSLVAMGISASNIDTYDSLANKILTISSEKTILTISYDITPASYSVSVATSAQ